VPHIAGSDIPSAPRPRRRRPRRSEPFGLVPDRVTATQTQEAIEAQALFDDLLALVDAGLVATLEDGGSIRYAAVDETVHAGAHGNSPAARWRGVTQQEAWLALVSESPCRPRARER